MHAACNSRTVLTLSDRAHQRKSTHRLAAHKLLRFSCLRSTRATCCLARPRLVTASSDVSPAATAADTAIVSLKILDWDGSGPSSAIADASLWLLSSSPDGVTPNPDNATNAQMLGVNVINMSFGYKQSPYGSPGLQMCKIMQQLLDAGIVPVAAAGMDECDWSSVSELPARRPQLNSGFCCRIHASYGHVQWSRCLLPAALPAELPMQLMVKAKCV